MIRFYLQKRIQRLSKMLKQYEQHSLLIITNSLILGIILYDKVILIIVTCILSIRLLNFRRSVLIAFCLFIGSFYSQYWFEKYESQKLVFDESVNLTIIEHPVTKNFDQELIVSIDSLSGFGIVRLDKYENVTLGQTLQAFISITKLEDKETLEDSYRQYLFGKQVWYEIEIKSVVSITDNNDLVSLLGKINNSFKSTINTNINEPYASLVNGIVIGRRESLPKTIKEELSITGLSHIISTSGMHVVLVYSFINTLLQKRLSKKTVQWVTIGILIIFMFLIGIYNMPALRAVLMSMIGIFAIMSGRSIQKLTLLSYTFIFILIIYPFYFQSISVQLTFLATIGLLYIFTPIKKLLFNQKFIPTVISDSLSIGIAANITTLPLTLSTFGTFSVIGFLSNILVTPFIPLMMLLYPLILLSSLIQFNFLEKILSILLETLTSSMTFLVNILSQVPFASVNALFGYAFLLIIIGILIYIDYKRFKKLFV